MTKHRHSAAVKFLPGSSGFPVAEAPDFQFQERLLAQHARDNLPESIGLGADDYFGRGAPVGGRSTRLAVRDGMDLLAHDAHLLDESEQSIVTDPCLAITLILSGAGEGGLLDPASLAPIGAPVVYVPATLYISHSTRTLCARSSAPGGTHYRMVELRITHAFLDQLGVSGRLNSLGPDHPFCVASGRGFWVGARQVSQAMLDFAERLHGDALDQSANDLTLEARSLEFLSATMELIDRHTRSDQAALSARTRKRIAEAAAQLRQDPARGWTIADLAQAVGLGEKTLKRGFRECFDTTVIAYLQTARLELARQLLADGGGNVADVSRRIGYANPSHFARLYRRQYGHPPSATS